jgi:hypothetical protein
MTSHIKRSRKAVSIGVYVLAILLALSAALLVPAALQKAKATACSVYQVGSPKSGSSSLASYTVYLMYNSCTGENFSLARVVITQHATPTNIQATVFRNPDGQDGGATANTESCGDIEHGFCGSAPVYSPHNTAYACVIDWNANMNALCTASY